MVCDSATECRLLDVDAAFQVVPQRSDDPPAMTSPLLPGGVAFLVVATYPEADGLYNSTVR